LGVFAYIRGIRRRISRIVLDEHVRWVSGRVAMGKIVVNLLVARAPWFNLTYHNSGTR
jgi:hypothetical protein